MGGEDSGRRRTRNRGPLEAVRSLDIRTLRRFGLVRLFLSLTGTMEWSWRGEGLGRVGLRVDLREPEAGLLTVAFATNGEPRRQEINIVSRPMPYGGWRYYFVCPRRGRRCEVLALVDGEFASRQAHHLTYDSQSDDRLDRVRRRRDRLWARLKPEGRQGPRGAHRERLFNAWCETERTLDQSLAQCLELVRQADEAALAVSRTASTGLRPTARDAGS